MIKRAMEKVLIVGSGMTGATIAAQLKKSISPKSLKILDKGRGAGGRMSTARSKEDGKYATVDLGAQYFSISSEYAEKHKSFHEELFSSGILKPFNGILEGQREKDGSSDHYIAPDGSNKVVKYFLEQSEAELMFAEQISHVNIDDGKIYVTSKDNSHECDALVLTMPVPQILALQGDIHNIIEWQPEIKKKLEEVSYSTRFCVGLFYNLKARINVPWDVKYYTDDPVIRYVSIDPKKRGNVNNSMGLSACVHSTVPFSLQYKDHTKQRVGMFLVKRLQQLEPRIPMPDEIKSHKWLYSQVHKGYPESPGCIVLSDNPPIILAGDAFTCSTMDGCIESAIAVNNVFVKLKGMAEYQKNRVNMDTVTVLDDTTKQLIDSYVAQHLDLYKASVNSEIESLNEQIKELKTAVKKLHSIGNDVRDLKESDVSVKEKQMDRSVKIDTDLTNNLEECPKAAMEGKK